MGEVEGGGVPVKEDRKAREEANSVTVLVEAVTVGALLGSVLYDKRRLDLVIANSIGRILRFR